MAKVKSLHFYPIKGFRGLSTRELWLDPDGPRYDRQWMLVNAENRFISLRSHPVLTTFGLRMDDVEIEIARSDLGSVSFALGEHQGESFDVMTFKHPQPAFEVSGEVSAWLSEALGEKVKLVGLSPESRRQVSAELNHRFVRFVDSQPLLVTSQAALAELESRSGVALSMARFRPNLVLEDVPAHAEDTWSGFKIGALNFKRTKACVRCKVTTIHPLTGQGAQEPLKTLATYRRGERGITFGSYYAHLNEGRVQVGDAVSSSPL
ncbi:MAG TPA: MOSC domain-containing protein [Bdellovibrionales bacterium]|nr:MOSC domain-containing protein [Bdellovibrionales bacterium]